MFTLLLCLFGYLGVFWVLFACFVSGRMSCVYFDGLRLDVKVLLVCVLMVF